MEKIDVKIKFTPQNTNLNKPVYATEGSSGADIYADILEDMTIAPNETTLVPTGIFMEIPYGYEIQIRPRSGLALKNSITLPNTPGTIDSDYRGELKIIVHNLAKEAFTLKSGDRIAQMVLMPVYKINWIEANELEETKRNHGGFGHTGVNA